MATISPRAQRLLQQLRRTLTRYTEQGRERPEPNSVKAQRALGVRIGSLIQRLRLALHLTPTHFARHLQVTPQTVHRWETHQVIPRLSQLQRFENLLDFESPWDQEQIQDRIPKRSSFTGASQFTGAAEFTGASDRRSKTSTGRRLAIGLTDELSRVMNNQAKAIWIFSSQRLLESEPGYQAEVVLKALQQGTHFHYVYPAGSEAEHSFESSLRPWLRRQSFTGSVTAYGIQRPRLAYQLGLADVPVTWMAIESASASSPAISPSGRPVTDPAGQATVLLQLRVREYVDSERRREKSDEGQPCWIELATPQAAAWWDKLTRLQNTTAVKTQAATATKRIRTITV